MIRRIVEVFVLFSVLTLQCGAKAVVDGEIETDRLKFLRLAKALEADPLQDEAGEMRAWLLNWVEETKGLTVIVCDVLGPIPEQDVPFEVELLTQSMFGNAIFQIENPSLKDNLLSTQTAGISSLLNAYSSIVASHPEAHISYYDVLLKMQSSGKLQRHMAPLVDKYCTEAADEPEE